MFHSDNEPPRKKFKPINNSLDIHSVLDACVLFIMFEYLMMEERISCMRVCKMWNEISSLCPMVTLNFQGRGDELLDNLIKSRIKIVSIEFLDCLFSREWLERFFLKSSIDELKHLKWNRITHDGIASLKSETLEKLEIYESNSIGMQLFPTNYLTNLRELSLCGNVENVQIIASNSQYSTLTSLTIQGSKPSQLKSILSSKSLTNLTLLDLKSENIGPGALHSISNSETFSKLKSLSLGYVDFNLVPGPYISNLTELNLNNLQKTDWKAISTRTELANLKKLDLSTITAKNFLYLCESKTITNLTDLRIEISGIESIDFISKSQSLIHIKHLHITTLREGRRILQGLSLSKYVKNLESLSLLNLEEPYKEKTSGNLKIIGGENFTKLSFLKLSLSSNVKEEAKEIASSPKMANLRRLELEDVTTFGFLAIIQSRYLNIERLNCSSSGLGFSSFKGFNSSQSILNVTSLILSFNKVDDQTMQIIGATPMKYLIELDLSSNEITHKGIQILSKSKYITKLKKLDVSRNYGIGNLGIQHFSTLNFEHVKTLNLSDISIDNDGLMELSRVQHLIKCINLKLDNNKITEVDDFMNSSNMPRLRYLSMEGNSIILGEGEKRLIPQLIKLNWTIRQKTNWSDEEYFKD